MGPQGPLGLAPRGQHCSTVGDLGAPGAKAPYCRRLGGAGLAYPNTDVDMNLNIDVDMSLKTNIGIGVEENLEINVEINLNINLSIDVDIEF